MADSKNSTWTNLLILLLVLGIAQGFFGTDEESESNNSGSESTSTTASRADIKANNRNQSKAIASEFIHALGTGNLKKAHQLQDIRSWGTIQEFSSPRLFGGITQTKVLTPPSVVICLDNKCLHIKVFVRYLSVDPVNDQCRSGRVFEQFFWIKQQNSEWKITKARLKTAAYCYTE